MESIIENIDLTTFKTMLSTLPSNNMIIVRFTAEWCRPCQTISPSCDEYFSKCHDNIHPIIIDIDEALDLYGNLKRYKMVNGIPALLAFYGDCKQDNWYIPNDSHVGGDISSLSNFFKRCDEHINSLK